MLPQARGKEPAGDREIFIVAAGQAGAVGAGFFRGRRNLRDCVGGGEAAPANSGGGRSGGGGRPNYFLLWWNPFGGRWEFSSRIFPHVRGGEPAMHELIRHAACIRL